MQSVVIFFLMGTGSLCILMQALVSYSNGRPVTTAKAAKVVAKADAAKSATAKSAAKAEDDPSGRDKVLAVVSDILGTRGPGDSKLGLLGFALMAVGVLLVIDFSVSVSFSTV